MRRWLPLCVLLCAAPASAQTLMRLASTPVAGNLATNGDVLTLPVPPNVGFGTIGVEARGTWTGTIEVQCAASTGGGAFVALNLAPRNSTTLVTSFTANGQWSGSIAGCQRVRATATAAMTGTATVTLVANFTAQSGSASAVSGGGAFTSQLLGPVGNCTTLPAYSFTGDPNTGMSSPSADVICFPTGGTSRLNITTTGISATLPLAVAGATVTDNDFTVLCRSDGWGWSLHSAAGGSNSIAGALCQSTGSAAVLYVRQTPTGGNVLSMDGVTAAFKAAAGGSYRFGTAILAINTAPTIASGFGTSPSVPVSNGTAAFTVNVGTGGTASAGVITMPAATTGYACSVENQTGVAANRANQRTLQTASTTTSVTVQNQTISTGAALAWTASDILVLKCTGY